MRSKLFIPVILSTFIVFFNSCVKPEEDSDPSDCSNSIPLNITLDNNPVSSGSSFQLLLNEVHSGSSYYWTGPNGWASTDAEPTIAQALSSHAGKYHVEEVTPWGCRIKASSDSVIVNLGTASCNPANNTASIASAGSMNFYAVDGYPSGGSYFITANSTGGDLELEFPGTSQPVAGTYTVRPLGGEWKTGDVRVRLVASSSNWPASSGKVYVTVTNNKVKAIFCNLPVYSQTWGSNSTANGHITEF